MEADLFCFECVPETCDLRCCTTGHPLVLSPFEIHRISRFTGISFDILEDDYFEESYDPGNGFPLITINRENTCPFLKNNACSIYTVRPLVCRLFPLGKLFHNGFRYVLLSENACAGFDAPKDQTVTGYCKNQDTAFYDRMWEVWVDFINKAETVGMADESLFRSAFAMMTYNTDLPPADLSIQKIASMSDEDIFRLRLKAAIEALPKLNAIFNKQETCRHKEGIA